MRVRRRTRLKVQLSHCGRLVSQKLQNSTTVNVRQRTLPGYCPKKGTTAPVLYGAPNSSSTSFSPARLWVPLVRSSDYHPAWCLVVRFSICTRTLSPPASVSFDIRKDIMVSIGIGGSGAHYIIITRPRPPGCANNPKKRKQNEN